MSKTEKDASSENRFKLQHYEFCFRPTRKLRFITDNQNFRDIFNVNLSNEGSNGNVSENGDFPVNELWNERREEGKF